MHAFLARPWSSFVRPLLARSALLLAGAAACGAACATVHPPHAPYRVPVADAMYNLLFCDDPKFFELRDPKSAQPWERALASRPANVPELRRLAEARDADSRIRAMAYERLRTAGQEVPRRVLLGVIAEVGLDGGLDTLAAYADGGVRYITGDGRPAIVEGAWEVSFPQVRRLFATAEPTLARWQPQAGPRASAPARGMVRLTFITSEGRLLMEAPFETVRRDPVTGPVLAAAGQLRETMLGMFKR